jgi:hypothetical protein
VKIGGDVKITSHPIVLERNIYSGDDKITSHHSIVLELNTNSGDDKITSHHSIVLELNTNSGDDQIPFKAVGDATFNTRVVNGLPNLSNVTRG